MIPVLGVPVLDRYDLLVGMEESIDWSVDRYYVVDNGGKYEGVGTPRADEQHVANVGVNLGFSASVNLIIRANFRAPWWLIVNDDIRFGDGDLERLDARMWKADGPLVCLLFGYSAFAVNDQAIDLAGWWDENYYPAYVEDCDWHWRANKLGVRFAGVEPNTTVHLGSQTIANEKRRRANDVTYPKNKEYHRGKWGGEPWQEAYDTPFDAGGDRSVTTAPKLSRLRELAW